MQKKVLKTQKKSKSKIKLLWFFILVVFLLSLSVLVLLIYADTKLNDDRNADFKNVKEVNLKDKNLIESFFSKMEEQINFVVFGLDHDKTRTDFIVIGQLDFKNNKIELISVPRDLYVEFSDEDLDFLKSKDRFLPANNYVKITQVHHYAGPEYGINYAVNKLEELFKISFDYYARIDLEGFRYLVDQMGGVEFDVPQRMFYEDIYQDLYIDLEKGEQVLDGKQAEGLIRYRKSNVGYEKLSPSYMAGDIQRIKVQQEFVKAMITQLVGKNLLSNTQAVIDTVDNYISTNCNAADITKYIKYANDFNSESIYSNVLPTQPKEVNGNFNEYQEMIEPDATNLINYVFYDIEYQDEKLLSTNKNIQILNGTSEVGLANTHKEILEEDGFTVINIGDYPNNKNKNTVIKVKKQGMGEDLLKYFKGAEIKVDSTLDYYDIVIILAK